jgi:hypothetical protein
MYYARLRWEATFFEADLRVILKMQKVLGTEINFKKRLLSSLKNC